MAQAYRCSNCGIDWPAVKDYAQCPGCEGKTFTLWDANPLSGAEAKLMVDRLAFGRWYEESRGVSVACESDPAGDPNRGEVTWSKPADGWKPTGEAGMWCNHPDVDGFFCWACDQIPRRPDENTDFERGLLGG